MHAHKGDWVRIYRILLTPAERSSRLPEETRKVPLEMRVNGFLLTPHARKGDEVKVETRTGRIVRGMLEEKNPSYHHAWGNCVPEILRIGPQLREMLKSRRNGDE